MRKHLFFISLLFTGIVLFGIAFTVIRIFYYRSVPTLPEYILPTIVGLFTGGGIGLILLRSKGYKERLEEKIALRTAELRESNKQLLRENTERKLAEEKLRGSETRYRQSVENSPNPIFSIDRNGKIQMWNRSCKNLFQYESKEIVGRTYDQLLFNPEDNSTVEAMLAQVWQGNALSDVDMSFQCKDGTQRFMVSRLYPLLDQKGNIQGCVLANTDITARKRAEDTLRENEEMYRLITENTMDVIWTTNTRYNFTFVNPVILTLTGYTVSEWLGTNLREYIPPEEYQKALDIAAKEMKDPEKSTGVRFESKLFHKNGSLLDVEINKKLIFDRGSNVVGFQGSAIDITDRKKAERALVESEERYRLIAENVVDVIWTSDMQYRLTYISPSIFQLSGYTVDDVMGRSLDEIMRPNSLEKVMTLYGKKQKQIEADDPEGWKPIVFEIEQNRKDGTTIWTNTNARILTGPDRKPASILGITRDITERKQTQETIVQTEKMMSVGGLAAGMAHEINNPLGIMMALAQSIERRCSPALEKNNTVAGQIGIDLNKVKDYMKERNIHEYLTGIREAGARAAKIVRNTLDFSRKSESSRAECSVQSMLDKAVDLASSDYDLKKKYDFRSVHIDRQFDEKLPLVDVVRTDIEQVFLNLLRNAAQAMREKTYDDDAPTIVLRTVREADWVRIEVIDNGPGMDATTRKRIFEPFYTTKAVGSGTGLGLSVSYFIITNTHQGELFVESNQNKGTKFIIRLPAGE